jgi:hypothetical protein
VRLASLLRSVSPSRSPNRTCEFPGIRLSMRSICCGFGVWISWPCKQARKKKDNTLLHRPIPLCSIRFPPIQFHLHVEDKAGIHHAGHKPTSCCVTVFTAFLRHPLAGNVSGFPALRLLRRLRPSSRRSSAVLSIPNKSGGSHDEVPRFQALSIVCLRSRLYPV